MSEKLGEPRLTVQAQRFIHQFSHSSKQTEKCLPGNSATKQSPISSIVGFYQVMSTLGHAAVEVESGFITTNYSEISTVTQHGGSSPISLCRALCINHSDNHASGCLRSSAEF